MTIVIGVAAPDGMILAAESRTTYMVQQEGRDGHPDPMPHHRILSDTAQKLFLISDELGVATYGDAGIGDRTISGLFDEFIASDEFEVAFEDEQSDAKRIALTLGQFFDARYRAATDPGLVAQIEQGGNVVLGFLVAGYDDDGIGRIHEVTIPGPTLDAQEPANTAARGVCWRGQYDVVRRLIKGWDVDLFYQLGHVLPDELEEPFAGLEYNLLFPITMQDAIDLSTFLIRTTVEMQRFSDGVRARPGELPGCGGPVRVVSITRDGASWVTPPQLSAVGTTSPNGEGGRVD
jgi:hypothetical protein